jgi:protocatechuate 3,4-dioxygenase beta subunit
LTNAQVHIWHCNAQGVYSGVSQPSNGGGADHTGENFLRGYQMTDANGEVTFMTIYPGWYPGRTVHIHIKVRVFDASGTVTTEATTQLFFDDSTSNSVFSQNQAYSRNGPRDTTNTSDQIYASENPTLLVSLNGTATHGYSGSSSLGIQVGTIYGG